MTIKMIGALVVLLGLVAYALVVATATPSDKEQYEAYLKYKERKKDDE